MKTKLVILLTFLLGIPGLLFAAWGRGRLYLADPYWGCGRGHFFGGGLFMMILTIIILGFLIFFVIKYFKNSRGDSLKKENPLDILKARYAKGEITKEVFENMKKDIENGK